VLEHAYRREPTEFFGGEIVRECRPISSLSCESDVDVRGGEDAGSGIDGIGSQTFVVAGTICLLVMRGRDGIQDREAGRAAEHLLGEHRVQLDAVELCARQLTGLIPDRVRDRGRAELMQ